MADFLHKAYLNAIYSAPSLNFLYRHSFWLFGLLNAIGYTVRTGTGKIKEKFFVYQKRQVYCRAVLRYSLCYVIAGYGFTKVLGIQFYLGINWRDMPLEQLNGFFLTWYYFYYSRPLVLIIAFLEITSSVLLLFDGLLYWVSLSYCL
jgi:hypothetical protein